MSRYSKNKGSNWIAGNSVHKSTRAVFITLLVASFMVMTSALPGLADDRKIYPGSMGVRYAGTSTPAINFSAIGNPSTTTWLYLDLPIVRDRIGGSVSTSWVRVIDQNCSRNISAQLCSVYRSGCAFYGRFSPVRYSSGCSCAEQVLWPGGVVPANNKSHYYLSCKIPPKYNNNTSYIVSYYAQEAGGVD